MCVCVCECIDIQVQICDYQVAPNETKIPQSLQDTSVQPNVRP